MKTASKKNDWKALVSGHIPGYSLTIYSMAGCGCIAPKLDGSSSCHLVKERNEQAEELHCLSRNVRLHESIRMKSTCGCQKGMKQ